MENKLNLPPFYVGQKVICVLYFNMRNIDALSGVVYPKKDEKYTVRSIHWDEKNKVWGIMLNEIINPKCNYADGLLEPVFTYYGFKPIQEAKLPLLTFTKIQETEKETILIAN